VGEVRYSEWEGKKVSKLARKPLWHAVQVLFPVAPASPGGEAMRDVQQRAVTALEETAARHERRWLSSSPTPTSSVWCWPTWASISIHSNGWSSPPAAVSILSLSPGGMVRVLRLNDDGLLHARTTPEPTSDKRKRKKKQPAGEPLAN
jgi:hypothetical protein